ncbi:MAG: transporter, family, multidrug resistance protein, partial [Gammaproteobacteria bacterium]|nr:transporter, family, multidrug resistance protein [Gammaproteobacteria bacterium]
FAAMAARKFNPLLLTAIGYGVFAAGLISDAFMTYDTDFDELLWPQILRGTAVLFCLLPTTSLALEGQPVARMPNASGLFNLMRNLGGAIGIALIDIVLEQRAPTHVAHLVARLQAGDTGAARRVNHCDSAKKVDPLRFTKPRCVDALCQGRLIGKSSDAFRELEVGAAIFGYPLAERRHHPAAIGIE